MKTIVAFGEIMGRLAAVGNLRLRQSREFDMTYAGAEASVATSICNFGGEARYVTALPKHLLAEAAIDVVRAVGVDTQFVVRTDKGRLGTYFLETGANQRPTNVIYDRENSSISITPANYYDWESIFLGSCWFHFSGITPALSKKAAEATLLAVKKAKEAGSSVSIDLNFREKLWKWKKTKNCRELAQETIRSILPYVDVVIGNEEDCYDVLGIRGDDEDVESGKLNTAKYPDIARQVVKQFPNVCKVAITLRESFSASHNNWGAMLYDSKTDTPYFAPLDDDGNYESYKIKNIIDRVGGGDSFAGGLIFALTTPELSETQAAVRFAVAASCLKHSIKGDFNFSTRSEVESLMGGFEYGRVVRQ